MINYIRSIIAGLLISAATFVSPVKQVTPTPTPKISVTVTPKVTTTVIPTPTTAVIQPQAQKCQYNKEQMTALLKQLDASDEYIKAFFEARPGDCFNRKNTSISGQVQNIEFQNQQNQQKIRDLENCQRDMDTYSSCMKRENQELEDYKDCVNSLVSGRYCSKPSTGFCFKPICSY